MAFLPFHLYMILEIELNFSEFTNWNKLLSRSAQVGQNRLLLSLSSLEPA